MIESENILDVTFVSKIVEIKMNDIMKLKKNHPCPTNKAICEIMKQHLMTSHSWMHQNESHLSEDQQKIEDLCLQLSAIKEKLDNDKKILQEKNKELNIAKQKLRELETEKNRVIKHTYTLEKKCHNLRIVKPNVKDQWILDLGQKKYNLYKQLTRIRWDFGALDTTVKGFVTDKKNYIRTFCFPKDIESKELCDLLWQEIQFSMETKNHDGGNDKENVNGLSNT